MSDEDVPPNDATPNEIFKFSCFNFVSFDLGIENKRNYSSQIEITLFQLSIYAVNLNKKSIIT